MPLLALSIHVCVSISISDMSVQTIMCNHLSWAVPLTSRSSHLSVLELSCREATAEVRHLYS